jgi:hypothetical protein
MTQQPPTMTPEQASKATHSSEKKRAYTKPTLTTLQPPELWKDDMNESHQEERDHQRKR